MSDPCAWFVKGFDTNIERPALAGIRGAPGQMQIQTTAQPAKSLRRLPLRRVAEAGRKWAALLEGPPAILTADLDYRRTAQKLDLHEQR